MNIKKFISIMVLNLVGFALFFSWYLPENHGFWFITDKSIFFWFNDRLVTNKALLWLVAITNFRLFDGVSLLAMGALYLHFWRRETPEGRRRMFAIGMTMLFSALLLNQLGHLIPVSHRSPTKFFPGVNHVAKLTGIPTKDASADSFPGDHGMMLMVFACFMLRYFTRGAFLIAVIIVLVFAAPRIMIGAHWFTDVAVGSLSIVLVGMSWWLIAPASDYLVNALYFHLPGKYKPTK
ncbi:phosphatase PAP2 family protein [Erwinia psidii]|uniref:Lipid A 1-diphosphate synthase n=1 Tax=Erwinia psidii TaxID=69224 RepID=A0A3N6S2K1_9GAMM|nr:phosphatase PAP2 family protein [Erwinia psidii]MCX8956529.1 phosphatase PAP2 family protein [Erwinia psidii]MCX8961561.1 phosphatase PAP2 family protein [Erwinia psidii]RQM39858.1 phosphatase PAP2 family protein [Erwinia psidii]